eukprot:3298136-Pleurochrysis_carterae.AAC.1
MVVCTAVLTWGGFGRRKTSTLQKKLKSGIKKAMGLRRNKERMEGASREDNSEHIADHARRP